LDAIRVMLRRLCRDERGATAIEYGLIVGLIAVTCIGAFELMGGGAGGMWTNVSTQVIGAMGPPTDAAASS